MVWYYFGRQNYFLAKLFVYSFNVNKKYMHTSVHQTQHAQFVSKQKFVAVHIYFLLRMERTGTKDSYTLFPSSVGLTFIFLTLLTFLCLSTYFILCLRNSRASIFIANLSISSPVQIHWSCLSILQYSC